MRRRTPPDLSLNLRLSRHTTLWMTDNNALLMGRDVLHFRRCCCWWRTASCTMHRSIALCHVKKLGCAAAPNVPLPFNNVHAFSLPNKGVVAAANENRRQPWGKAEKVLDFVMRFNGDGSEFPRGLIRVCRDVSIRRHNCSS